MVDSAALREALDRPDGLYPNPKNFMVIEAAAREFLRLMETAETVWWCEEHRASGFNGGRGKFCHLHPFPGDDDGNADCRMVEAVLTRRDTEETVTTFTAFNVHVQEAP